MKSGLASARARGVKLGRQLGHRPSDKKAKKVLALHKEGLSYRLMGRNLGLSKNTVMEIVKRKRCNRPSSGPARQHSSVAKRGHQRDHGRPNARFVALCRTSRRGPASQPSCASSSRMGAQCRPPNQRQAERLADRLAVLPIGIICARARQSPPTSGLMRPTPPKPPATGR